LRTEHEASRQWSSQMQPVSAVEELEAGITTMHRPCSHAGSHTTSMARHAQRELRGGGGGAFLLVDTQNASDPTSSTELGRVRARRVRVV